MSEEMREKFESWAKSDGMSIRKIERPHYGFVYVAESTHFAWQAWQAREAELQELREALANVIGWLGYAEECDPFYFSDEREPQFHIDKARAESALSGKPAGERDGKN